VAISKLLFFSLLEMQQFSFFLEIFQNLFHHVCFQGGLLRNKYDLKKLRDFTMFEGHGYPLININHTMGRPTYKILDIFRWSSKYKQIGKKRPPLRRETH
jgi:hypothetical protein